MVRLGVADFLSRWRTYLYDDGVAEPTVGHLNGAQALAWDTVQERFGSFTGIGQRWQREGFEDAGGQPVAHRKPALAGWSGGPSPAANDTGGQRPEDL